jgi:hypothetical protein
MNHTDDETASTDAVTLAEDYPFDPSSRVYSGVLTGAEAMIYSETRTFARDGLVITDFYREPEFEEDELNHQLGELHAAVTMVYGQLTQPGPWRGIADGDDVPRAVAEIAALVGKLLMPAMLVEDAIVEARVSGLERQRGTAKHQEGVRWRARNEFADQVSEAARESGTDLLPLELRLAHLDRLIALGQLRRASLLREHHHDAWLAGQRAAGRAAERASRDVGDVADADRR